MPAIIWIILGVIVLGALFGGKGKRSVNGPHRIDHPHVIDDDDYECSVCHRRFRKAGTVCPYCGTHFSGSVVDDGEFEDEEDELEAWDEEDGL